MLLIIGFQHGTRIDQIGLIFDMEGIGMKHLWKPGKFDTSLLFIIIIDSHT